MKDAALEVEGRKGVGVGERVAGRVQLDDPVSDPTPPL